MGTTVAIALIFKNKIITAYAGDSRIYFYNKNKILEGSRLAYVIIYALAFVLALICIYPIYYVLILSLSDPEYAITMKVYLWPKGWNLSGYQSILRDSRLWLAYRLLLTPYFCQKHFAAFFR